MPMFTQNTSALINTQPGTTPNENKIAQFHAYDYKQKRKYKPLRSL